MVMSRDQNAGRSRNIKTDNSSFARVEQFRYLGTTITDQNSIQEEIKSKFIMVLSILFINAKIINTKEVNLSLYTS